VVINCLIVFRSASSTKLRNATRVADDVSSEGVVVIASISTRRLVSACGDIGVAVFALLCFLLLLGAMLSCQY